MFFKCEDEEIIWIIFGLVEEDRLLFNIKFVDGLVDILIMINL